MSQQLKNAVTQINLQRLREVSQRTGLSKSTIYRLEAQGLFPRRVKLGERISAYRSDEVTAWIEARTAEARGAA